VGDLRFASGQTFNLFFDYRKTLSPLFSTRAPYSHRVQDRVMEALMLVNERFE
jgi:hypothetical protein